jgi:archaeal flagellar protein FlaJ
VAAVQFPGLAPEEKAAPLLSTFDKFVRFSFRIFSGPASSISNRLPKLRDDIQRSNLRTTPEGLISVGLLVTTITALVSVSLVVVGTFVEGIIWFVLAPISIPIGFIVVISLPRLGASSRSAGIENELPFVLGYMSVLAGGGVAPMATMRRISEMSLLPSSQKEAKRILIETEVFGADPITAMETIAKTTPSRHWAEFLAGYTSVLKTGGDFNSYISTKLKDIISLKSAAIKRSSDLTGTLAEAYLTITVILGMTLYTLDMIQVLLTHSNAGLQQLYLFSFVIIPLFSAAFVYMVDSIQLKWPFTDWRPYKHLLYSVPLGVVVFFLPLPLPLYLHTAVSLVVSMATPAFFATKYSRERRSLERALPDFLRDVAEGRKTGLSPEKSIERLVSRPYGPLSKHVRKMGSQLSWGVELSVVVRGFTKNVASWITRAISTLLIEVVDVGGGTIRSFTEMADFSRTINDMEGDRRSALRPFIFITYVAGVMVVLTTFILVYMLAQPSTIGFAATPLDPATVDALLTTAVFDTFVIGLVAGKLGESSVADGFKHAIALVVVSVGAVLVAKQFIAIPV